MSGANHYKQTRRDFTTALQTLNSSTLLRFDYHLDGNPIENRASLAAAKEWLKIRAAQLREALALVEELDTLIEDGADVAYWEQREKELARLQN